MRESPKLFFARRSAMPGDYAIIATAAVSQQERLRRTQDNPRFGVGPPALVLRHRPSAVVETAGSPRRRLFLVLLVAPIDVALNPAAGPGSLRRPSNRSVGRYLFTRFFKRTASTVLRCRFAPAKGCPPLALHDETRPGACSAGSAAMRSSQSRRGRTVYPLNREETP
jgi:hypothetical protein